MRGGGRRGGRGGGIVGGGDGGVARDKVIYFSECRNKQFCDGVYELYKKLDFMTHSIHGFYKTIHYHISLCYLSFAQGVV